MDNIKNNMVAYVKGIEEARIDTSKIKVDMLKNTWNHIREAYVRYKNSQPPSGSAAKDVDPPEHSEIMREYDDMIVKRRQVSSLDDEGAEDDSGNKKVFYTPKNKHSKPNKSDDSQVTPFIASATTFLSKLSDENATKSIIATNPIEDKTVLFANSIIPDLKKFDDEHFALIKMIIAKDIYDVLLKQIEKTKK